MLDSTAWSESRSGVTEEGGGVGHQSAAVGVDGWAGLGVARERSVVPRVKRSLTNRSDQRVPVYWDQTVPVWRGPGEEPRRRASRGVGLLHGRRWGSSRRDGGDSGEGVTSEEEILGESCWRIGGSGSGTRFGENVNGSCGVVDCTGRGDGFSARANAAEVSFDAILSMYESSIVEKSVECSRRDHYCGVGRRSSF